MIRYDVERRYEGKFYVMCSEDDQPPERVASVGRFMPGPMVSYEGPKITPPTMALAVARAMTLVADEIDPYVKRLRDAVDATLRELEASPRLPPMGGWRDQAIKIVACREGINPYALDGMIGGSR